MDENRLAAWLWERNPELRQAVNAQRLARIDASRARVPANPELELGVSSLPLGGALAVNPQETLDNVDWTRAPAYSLELSQPLDPWRRGLRIERAEHGIGLAQEQTRELFQQRLADVFAVMARMAAARQRVALFERQLKSVEELKRLTAVGVRAAYVPGLEVEKLEVEAGRLRTLSDEAELGLQEALAEWARLMLSPAPSLGAEEARLLLERLARLPDAWPVPEPLLASSPQQRQLAWQGAQATTDMAIAERQRWPELALRLGYTHNTLSGNVLNSLQSGLSLGIPVWNAGRLDHEDALIRLQGAEEARRALADQQVAQAGALRRRAAELQRMAARLQSTQLVAANATLTRLEAAATKRLLPMSEVIHLRRTVLELEGDRLDLLEKLATTLIEHRRLLAWRLPEPPEPQ